MDRISLSQEYARTQRHVAGHQASISRIREMLATGRKVQRPSDAASEMGRLFRLRREAFDVSRFGRISRDSGALLETSATTVSEVGSHIDRIRELTLQGANGSLSAADRSILGLEIDQLLGGLVSSANSHVDDHFVFGGPSNGRPPFELRTGADGFTRVQFRGEQRIRDVEAAPGIRIALGLSAGVLLQRGVREPTEFTGTTGASAGSGRDSGTGNALLTLRHVSSSYGSPSDAGGGDPISGLRPAPSSSSLDTVLGLDHTITLSTDASGIGTIALDGSPPIAFARTDGTVELVAPDGAKVTVDVSNVAGGLSGVDVPVGGQGAYSLDGGLTEVAIDFAAVAQQVRHSETGELLHVNGTQIRQAGQEAVTFPGTHDLFQTVIAIRDTLNDPTLSADAVSDTLNRHLTDLARAREGVGRGLTELDARRERIELISARLDSLEVTLAGLESEIVDVDPTTAVTDLAKYETLLQASLLMASRLDQISLLNYL